jgi:hypothetical protein
MNGGLAYLGLAEAAELIRTKKLSPVEYVTALLPASSATTPSTTPSLH